MSNSRIRKFYYYEKELIPKIDSKYYVNKETFKQYKYITYHKKQISKNEFIYLVLLQDIKTSEYIDFKPSTIIKNFYGIMEVEYEYK